MPEAIDFLESVRERNREVIARLNQNERMIALKESKPALVLSGGGAKGAYQAGALFALYDCGVREIHSIAGTSVGGLNGGLYQRLINSGDPHVMLDVWSNLSFSNILKPTFWSLVKIALYIPISVLAQRDLLDRLNNLVSLDICLYSISDYISRLVLGIAICTVTLCVYLVFLLMFLALLILLPLQAKFGLDQDTFLRGYLIFGFFLMPALARLAGRRLGIVSNGPLRKTIEQIGVPSIQNSYPKLSCTLATKRFGRWCPLYARLDQDMTSEEAKNTLLQTAALPEIFPMRAIRGQSYVDGGVVDNTPIYAVAEERPASLIVLYLDHRLNRMLRLYQKHRQGITFAGNDIIWSPETALKLWEYDRLVSLAHLRNEDWERHRSWFHQARLLAIVPPKSLGGFICGTLNFTKSKAQRLLADGYSDTAQQLTEWAEAKPIVVAQREDNPSG